jgi:hypothetical protein
VPDPLRQRDRQVPQALIAGNENVSPGKFAGIKLRMRVRELLGSGFLHGDGENILAPAFLMEGIWYIESTEVPQGKWSQPFLTLGLCNASFWFPRYHCDTPLELSIYG